MTAIAHTPDRGTTGLVSSTLTITRRAALRYLRTPQLIVMATLQMSLFFLIYRYMFGGAIHAGSIPYVDYLVPGFVATGVLFSGIGAAVATAEDLEQGFVDRLRSLPIPRIDIDHTTVKLLVPDGANIDHDDLRRIGRGRVTDWTGTPVADGREIKLVGEMRNAEVRVHRGGVAVLSLLTSREHRRQVREAHRAGRLDPSRDQKEKTR